MQLREDEIDQITFKLGRLSDEIRVAAPVGEIRALIERNSYEAANRIYQLEATIKDLEEDLKHERAL